jgi:predicted ATP-grasp superfamily ATP-dependent carboligase
MAVHATKIEQENRSQLLAVWPGMGHVALTAGLYLMSKLHMHEEEPVATGDLFDLDHVDVKEGMAQAGRLPVSHLYASAGVGTSSNLGLVIGEAQPPLHKLEYCRRILDGAQKFGVGRVVTFAAMAIDIHPRDRSRVFGVATHPEGLEALRRHGIEILDAGQIQGMNGVFLAAAAQRGITGLCLLGTMPSLATQIPYPKASHAILEAFASLSNLDLDLKELEEYGRNIEERLTAGLERLQEALEEQGAGGAASSIPSPDEESSPSSPSDAEKRKIEQLFEQASLNRGRAFELKRELDRLGLFKQYENRFLDLFRRSSS